MYKTEEVVKLVGYKYFNRCTISSTIIGGKDPHIYSIGDKIKMEEGMRINIDLTTNG